MRTSNHYTIIAEVKGNVSNEYKGTNLEEALKIFRRLDSSKYCTVYFYINDELVEL